MHTFKQSYWKFIYKFWVHEDLITYTNLNMNKDEKPFLLVCFPQNRR